MANGSVLARLSALSGLIAGGLIVASVTLTDPYDAATDPHPGQSSALLARALVNNRENARLGAYLGLLGSGSVHILIFRKVNSN